MKRNWIITLSILILLFIWLQSAVPVTQSARESKWLTRNVINPILQCVGLEAVEDRVVRKAAHITEFFLLSVIAAQFWGGKPIQTIYTGLTAAFLDESIQLLSNRGALISDVWIDMIGVGAGTIAGCLIWWLVKWIGRSKLGG